MINLTIDGKKIEVTEGTTVLQAARQAEVFIPTLCDHPELTPYGGCRLCLVQVDGMRGLQPSCTLPASNNMVVTTDNDQIRAARRFVLTLIFSERNHFCPYCQVSGGDCELQNAAYHEGMTHWPIQPNYQPYAMDASHPYFVLENNRCILCRRCVRACGELVGNFTLGFEERGAKSFLVADLNVPLGESSCISCGTCIQVCPTGALIDRASAYRGRETQVEHHKTICTACSVGCGMDVLTRDNQIMRIEGDWDAPVNSGVICKYGRFTPLDEKRARLTTPMVRENGALKPASWEKAIQTLAEKLGKGGAAAIVSTRLSAEALHLFKQVFANSDMVTSLEEGLETSAAAKAAEELGQPFEGKLDDVLNADLMLTLGADLVEEHQVAGFFVKRSVPTGVKLVVVDAEESALKDLADVMLNPTTADAAVPALAAAVAGVEVGMAAAVTAARLNLEALRKAGGLIKASKRPVFIVGKGITSPAAVKALVELARSCKAAIVTLKGSGNSLAASQLGLDQPFKLNGHQSVFVALGDEEPTQRLVQRLEKAPFLAVQAAYESPLTAKADVVLPAANWAEEGGHYLNLDGRLQEAVAALTPAEGVQTHAQLFKALAEHMNRKVNEKWEIALKERVAPVSLA